MSWKKNELSAVPKIFLINFLILLEINRANFEELAFLHLKEVNKSLFYFLDSFCFLFHDIRCRLFMYQRLISCYM